MNLERKYSFDIPVKEGMPHRLEFRKVTGELDHSNSYQVYRVRENNTQQLVGSLNERYFYPEKELITILRKGEMHAIGKVMDWIEQASVTLSNNNS